MTCCEGVGPRSVGDRVAGWTRAWVCIKEWKYGLVKGPKSQSSVIPHLHPDFLLFTEARHRIQLPNKSAFCFVFPQRLDMGMRRKQREDCGVKGGDREPATV